MGILKMSTHTRYVTTSYNLPLVPHSNFSISLFFFFPGAKDRTQASVFYDDNLPWPLKHCLKVGSRCLWIVLWDEKR